MALEHKIIEMRRRIDGQWVIGNEKPDRPDLEVAKLRFISKLAVSGSVAAFNFLDLAYEFWSGNSLIQEMGIPKEPSNVVKYFLTYMGAYSLFLAHRYHRITR